MDNLSRIACCNTCLLTTMRDCTHCPFNPGSLPLKPSERETVARVELLKPLESKQNEQI